MGIEWFILLLTTVATWEGTNTIELSGQNYDKRRYALDAPVFSPGTENLSYEECGLWDGNGDMPWTVIITIEGQNWETPGWFTGDLKNFQEFYGFLITKKTVLVFRNPMDTGIIENYRLYAGPCDSGSNEGNCKFGRGLLDQKVQSRSYTFYNLEVWEIKKVTLTQYLRPICLWNRNNQQDSSFDSFVFTQVDRKLKNTTLWSRETCRTLKRNRNFSGNRNLYMYTDYKDSGVFLIMKDSNRYYLRATRYLVGQNETIIWTDILNDIKEIVDKLDDVYLMPPIPKLATKIEFGAEESYEGCGKVDWERRGGRQRRDDLAMSYLHHGTNAPIEENPWHVSLTINLPTTDALYDACGGTLVSKRVIVTAAHCMFSPTGIRFETEWLEIALGMDNIEDTTENGRQIVKAASVIIHPDYNNDRKDWQHDLALIILNENSIHLSDRVKPACLWNSDYDFDKIAGKDGKVTGFGLTANYTQARILQKAFLRIASHNQCFFSNKKFFLKYLRPTQNFCAGFPHNGTGVCFGDSGGGLLIANTNGTSISDKRFYLRGVVSFGPSRIRKKNNVEKRVCDTNQFSLFVDVTRYIAWIVQNSPDISLRL